MPLLLALVNCLPHIHRAYFCGPISTHSPAMAVPLASAMPLSLYCAPAGVVMFMPAPSVSLSMSDMLCVAPLARTVAPFFTSSSVVLLPFRLPRMPWVAPSAVSSAMPSIMRWLSVPYMKPMADVPPCSSRLSPVMVVVPAPTKRAQYLAALITFLPSAFMVSPGILFDMALPLYSMVAFFM